MTISATTPSPSATVRSLSRLFPFFRNRASPRRRVSLTILSVLPDSDGAPTMRGAFRGPPAGDPSAMWTSHLRRLAGVCAVRLRGCQRDRDFGGEISVKDTRVPSLVRTGLVTGGFRCEPDSPKWVTRTLYGLAPWSVPMNSPPILSAVSGLCPA
jgi:hypothetical protein